MKAKFIIATLFDTMYVLQLYDFETTAVLCDGASSNLSALKLLTGFCHGACCYLVTVTGTVHRSPQLYIAPPTWGCKSQTCLIRHFNIPFAIEFHSSRTWWLPCIHHTRIEQRSSSMKRFLLAGILLRRCSRERCNGQWQALLAGYQV